MRTVYFDHAATTHLYPEVSSRLSATHKECFGNPSSSHSGGRKAKALIENARRSIAKELAVKAKEIVFTASGTEANNWVIKHAVAHLGVRHVITSKIEHKCVARAIEYVHGLGAEVTYLENDDQGVISCIALEKALAKTDHPTLVAIMHANNELGTLQPVKEIGELCQMHNALFFSDTVQTIGHYAFCPRDYHMDFCSASAHKFHGPKGVGFVYINENQKLKPWILGGGQEYDYRSGTENVHGIDAMALALQLSNAKEDHHKQHALHLKEALWKGIQEVFPDVYQNGHPTSCLYSVLNVSFPAHVPKEQFLFELDMAGIYVSGGSACSSGAAMDSHVLQAIGHDNTRKAIRFSIAYSNTLDDVQHLVEALKSLKARYQRNSVSA